MIPTKFGLANLELLNFPTFDEKLDAIIAQLEIKTVFCKLQKGQIPDALSTGHFNVVEVIVPGGNPSYVKSHLQDILKILRDYIDDFVANHDDYYSIRKTLENSKEKCVLYGKKNDINKSLYYHENDIKWMAEENGRKHHLFFRQLIFEQSVENEISDHFSIRKEFFEEMTETIDKKLALHIEIPPFPKKPYKWNSNNSHLEIAELLYAIIQKRIQIKENEKGSYSKLVKEFYNLFGLDDALYHQKLQDIRKRKNKTSWLAELVEPIEALKKLQDSTKKES